jgi:hypothetical protein
MKRNNLIAIAVGTILGAAALSSAYADEQLALAAGNQQTTPQAPNAGNAGGNTGASQAGTPLNPEPFGTGADRSDQQPSGQPDRRHDHRNDVRSDRRDIGSDRADIRADRRDIWRDSRDIWRDSRDIRADQMDLRHDYAAQRAGAKDQRDIARDQADISSDRRDIRARPGGHPCRPARSPQGRCGPAADIKKTRAGRGEYGSRQQRLRDWASDAPILHGRGATFPSWIHPPKLEPSGISYRARRPSEANSRL